MFFTLYKELIPPDQFVAFSALDYISCFIDQWSTARSIRRLYNGRKGLYKRLDIPFQFVPFENFWDCFFFSILGIP